MDRGALHIVWEADLVFIRQILEECLYGREQLWNWRMLIALHARLGEVGA